MDNLRPGGSRIPHGAFTWTGARIGEAGKRDLYWRWNGRSAGKHLSCVRVGVRVKVRGSATRRYCCEPAMNGQKAEKGGTGVSIQTLLEVRTFFRGSTHCM